MLTYAEKLKDPRWQKKRLQVFERDKWTCQNKACGRSDKNLQVHHLDYIPGIDVWDYPMDMLTTLCEICHDKEFGRGYMEKHLATTLKMKGFLMSDLLALSCLIETKEDFAKSLLKVLHEFQER